MNGLFSRTVSKLPLAPMLATPGNPPIGENWAYEMKWDGVRCLAHIENGRCRLISRTGQNMAGTYPELATAVIDAAHGRDAVLDGEIVALDPRTGAPSFSRLQRRINIGKPTTDLIQLVPAALFVFDLLLIDSDILVSEQYLNRRQQLADFNVNQNLISVPRNWVDANPADLLEAARSAHLEGIVAKKVTSIYQPGRRSPDWIKHPLRQRAEAIVCGWIPGSGPNRATFGALVLGAHSEGRLRWIGNVGTGFTSRARQAMRAEFTALEIDESPFSVPPEPGRGQEVHWLKPVLVGEVEYREYHGSLRHPSWKGLRIDKRPEEVEVPQ